MLAGIIWLQTSRWRRDTRVAAGWLAAALVRIAGSAVTAIHMWGDAVGLHAGHAVHALHAFVLIRSMPSGPGAARSRRSGNGAPAAHVAWESRQRRRQLNYPLKPLNCTADDADLSNIVVILIDALRPDSIVAELTPTLAAFRADSIRFNQQYSGGNSSRMGLFRCSTVCRARTGRALRSAARTGPDG